FFSSRRRHTRSYGDWSSDVCSSDLAIGDIDLVAVTVPLADPVGTVNRGDAAFRVEHRVIGPEAHRAAEIAIGLALFQFVAAHPRSEERRVGKSVDLEWRQNSKK